MHGPSKSPADLEIRLGQRMVTFAVLDTARANGLSALERDRLESKKISKTRAVTSVVGHDMRPSDVHIGPSDYVEWLSDRKWAFIRLEGRGFGDQPLSVELKPEVWDSPNPAGVVIDAVRCAKLARDRGLTGAIEGPSAYFMKSPPVQYADDEARQMVADFIASSTVALGKAV